MAKMKLRAAPDCESSIGVLYKGKLRHLGRVVVRDGSAYFIPCVQSWPDGIKFSYHRSGQRHVKIGKAIVGRLLGEANDIRRPPRELTEVEAIAPITILRGDLEKQPEYGSVGAPTKPDILLDADGNGFRDDVSFFRVFFVPAGVRPEPPLAARVGPIARELLVVSESFPQIAVCLFQELASADDPTEICRETNSERRGRLAG